MEKLQKCRVLIFTTTVFTNRVENQAGSYIWVSTVTPISMFLLAIHKSPSGTISV